MILEINWREKTFFLFFLLQFKLKILEHKTIHFFCCSAKTYLISVGKINFERRKDFSRKELSFCQKLSSFLVPISLELDGVNIISNLGCFTVHRIHSLKYQDLIFFEPMF